MSFHLLLPHNCHVDFSAPLKAKSSLLVNLTKGGAGTQIQWLKVMAKMVVKKWLFIAFPFFPYLDNTLCILVLQRCVNFTRVHFECFVLAFFKVWSAAKIPILLKVKDLKVFQITPLYLDTL